MARIRTKRSDVDGAVQALDLVPSTSRAYSLARQARANLLAASGAGIPSLSQAWSSVDQVLMDPRERAGLDVRIFSIGLDEVGRRGEQPASDHRVPSGHRHGVCVRPSRVRLRQLARLTPDREERVQLVDQANDVRPWTLGDRR